MAFEIWIRDEMKQNNNSQHVPWNHINKYVTLFYILSVFLILIILICQLFIQP